MQFNTVTQNATSNTNDHDPPGEQEPYEPDTEDEALQQEIDTCKSMLSGIAKDTSSVADSERSRIKDQMAKAMIAKSLNKNIGEPTQSSTIQTRTQQKHPRQSGDKTLKDNSNKQVEEDERDNDHETDEVE